MIEQMSFNTRASTAQDWATGQGYYTDAKTTVCKDTVYASDGRQYPIRDISVSRAGLNQIKVTVQYEKSEPDATETVTVDVPHAEPVIERTVLDAQPANVHTIKPKFRKHNEISITPVPTTTTPEPQQTVQSAPQAIEEPVSEPTPSELVERALRAMLTAKKEGKAFTEDDLNAILNPEPVEPQQTEPVVDAVTPDDVAPEITDEPPMIVVEEPDEPQQTEPVYTVDIGDAVLEIHVQRK